MSSASFPIQILECDPSTVLALDRRPAQAGARSPAVTEAAIPAEVGARYRLLRGVVPRPCRDGFECTVEVTGVGKVNPRLTFVAHDEMG